MGIMVFFIFLMVRTSSPDMSLLFSQLDPADGGRILEKLKSMNVPTDVKGDGTQIYVPTDQVARLRMELAQDGMLTGGSFGYEIFDKSDMLGSTTALLDINRLRAMEGELSKSIRTIQGVQSARVHLVLPKRELFSQEKQQPAASIILKMKGAARLSVTQVQSIQYLVASAVPSLTLDKISIVDDKGNLLAKGNDRLEAGDSFTSQQDIRQSYESKISRAIESMLDKTLGFGKSRAEVTAEMDFDKVTMTSVEFNPDGQVARSSTTAEEGSNANEAAAVDNVSIQNALPDGGGQGGQAQNKNQATKTEENVTYEISNTTKTHIKETGAVKRLSIAVLVDGTYNNNQFSPRPQEELDQITALIKSAVGFKEDRGDNIKVVSMKFSETPDTPDVFEWGKWAKTLNYTKIIEISVISIVGLVFAILVLKPFLLMVADKNLQISRYSAFANASGRQLPRQKRIRSDGAPDEEEEGNETGEEEDEEDDEEGDEYNFKKKKSKLDSFMNSAASDVKDSSVKKIREIIDKHPEEAVSILRSWMYADK